MEQFGIISDVFIPLDKARHSMGYGYVTFMIPEQAIEAIPVSIDAHSMIVHQKIDNKPFQGRNLKVQIAKQKVEVRKPSILLILLLSLEPQAHTYKGEKFVQKKKEEEDGNDNSWNSLYINKDSVINAVSNKLGVNYRDVMNVEEGNMAVCVFFMV